MNNDIIKISCLGVVFLFLAISISAAAADHTETRYNIIGGSIMIDSCYGVGIGSFHALNIGNRIIVFFDFYRPFFRIYGYKLPGLTWVSIDSYNDIGFILDFKGFAIINGYVDGFGGVVNIFGDNIYSSFIVKK